MITIKKAGADGISPKPGTWNRFKVPGGHSILMCCPNGHIGSLDDHDIATDGEVSPSVQCPDESCDFHDMVRLESW